MKLRLAALAVALLWLSPALKATAIVMMRTPTRIVLAADSAATHVDGTVTVTVTTDTCKIRQAGQWWIQLAGFTSTTAGTLDRTPLDVFGVVQEAVAPTRTVSDALDAVKVAYLRPGGIRDELAKVATHPQFGELFKPGQGVLAVVVAGLDQGVLTVGYIDTYDRPENPVRRGICPGECAGDVPAMYGASVADAPLQSLVRTLPRPAWLERADPAAARRLIELQIAATPARVKRPIDVLEIGADGGARWVGRERGSVCAAIP